VFKTEERLKSTAGKKSVERMNSEQQQSSHFKAREMPNYKFFEVKHSNPAEHEKIVFKEFNLATANIKRVRANSHDQDGEDLSN
jgi:hypothetical protein